MVTLYTKSGCVQCTATSRRFDAKGVEYRTVNMTEDGDALEKVKSLGHMSAPVVVTADGTSWSGFRPDLIDTLF